MKHVIVYGPRESGVMLYALPLAREFGCVALSANWQHPFDLHVSGDGTGCLWLYVTNANLEDFKAAVEVQAGIDNPVRIVKYTDTETYKKKVPAPASEKPTNPKDAVGIKKWRQFCTVPLTVMTEVGVAMMEGAMKYGRHNYRSAGVRASVYVDAAMGHVTQWWEGEDFDPDSGLSHITKAIASLTVLRDAMIQSKLTDDRPPKANLDQVRNDLQKVVDQMFDKYPEPKPAFTEVQDA